MALAVEKKLASKPHIAKSLIPTFAVGCRRLTPGPGYLEALASDNVDFISAGIKRVTETGIEDVEGNHREYDTIVCATGCVCRRSASNLVFSFGQLTALTIIPNDTASTRRIVPAFPSVRRSRLRKANRTFS